MTEESVKELKQSELIALLSSVGTMEEWKILYDEATRRGINVVFVDPS